MRYEQVSGDDVAAVEAVERPELERRAALYRNGRPAPDLSGRSALIIDDGFATGATARVACMIARAQGAARVILAAAIGPRNAVAELWASTPSSTTSCAWALQPSSPGGARLCRFRPNVRQRGL